MYCKAAWVSEMDMVYNIKKNNRRKLLLCIKMVFLTHLQLNFSIFKMAFLLDKIPADDES